MRCRLHAASAATAAVSRCGRCRPRSNPGTYWLRRAASREVLNLIKGGGLLVPFITLSGCRTFPLNFRSGSRVRKTKSTGSVGAGGGFRPPPLFCCLYCLRQGLDGNGGAAIGFGLEG